MVMMGLICSRCDYVCATGAGGGPDAWAGHCGGYGVEVGEV